LLSPWAECLSSAMNGKRPKVQWTCILPCRNEEMFSTRSIVEKPGLSASAHPARRSHALHQRLCVLQQLLVRRVLFGQPLRPAATSLGFGQRSVTARAAAPPAANAAQTPGNLVSDVSEDGLAEGPSAIGDSGALAAFRALGIDQALMVRCAAGCLPACAHGSILKAAARTRAACL
jgi:hypothetical protein